MKALASSMTSNQMEIHFEIDTGSTVLPFMSLLVSAWRKLRSWDLRPEDFPTLQAFLDGLESRSAQGAC